MTKTRHGEMSLYSVIFMLVLACVMFPLYEYICIYEEGQEIRAKVQTDLDAYVSSSCVNSIDSLKDGKLSTSSTDFSDFESQEGDSLGLAKSVATWSSDNANYTIQNMSTQIKNTGHTIAVFTQYQLVIPIKLLNMTIAKPTITQTAESYIAEKYFSANQFEDKYITGSYKDDYQQPPEKAEYTITVEATNGGTASVNKPTCSNLETCTVTAVPAQYKKFVEWRNSFGIPVSMNQVYTFTPSANTVMTAVFADAAPASPTVNLISGTQDSSSLRNFSLSLDCPEANKNLADSYTVQIAALKGFPYSSLSEEEKKTFSPWETLDLVITASGTKTSSRNYTDCNITPEGAGKYKISASEGTFGKKGGLAYDYIAVGAYGTGNKVNGKANIKVYHITNSEISLVAEYNDQAVPEDGILGILRSK